MVLPSGMARLVLEIKVGLLHDTASNYPHSDVEYAPKYPTRTLDLTNQHRIPSSVTIHPSILQHSLVGEMTVREVNLALPD